MDVETAFYFVEQYGYIALFLVLWIGFFCIPVPNEVIVMTSGFLIAQGIFSVIPGFLITYFGVVMSLTTLYILGRYCFHPIRSILLCKPKFKKHIDSASRLIERYGPLALMIGYCFPGVRHFVPFIIGSNQMSYRMFATYAYGTVAAWTTVYFLLGYYFGENMDHILRNIFVYGTIVLSIGSTLLGLIFYRRRRKKYKYERIS
jgi:membrane-associated protein